MLVFVILAGLGVSASKEMIAAGNRSGLAHMKSELVPEILLAALQRRRTLQPGCEVSENPNATLRKHERDQMSRLERTHTGV